MESLNDVISKRFSRTLIAFLRLVDPDKHFQADELLGRTWDRLSLCEQRKLYLFLLYRKWRGLDIYGEPYYIIRNCHPAPFNWNGNTAVDELAKQNKLVSAKHNNNFGLYTKDEALLYNMTDVKPFNFKQL